MIVAIDGPAGSGKSTVARLLAQKLGIAYLDTGAMYRGLTLSALTKSIDLDDDKQVVDHAKRTSLLFRLVDGVDTLFINDEAILTDGRSINDAIREPDVTASTKTFACNSEVRALMVEQQKAIGETTGSLVTEGRDQATIVFPDAEYKFYLDASPEIRARRRFEQLQAKGETSLTYEQILDDQLKRDHSDKTRETGPLAIAKDAVVVDTSEMTIEEVVEHLYSVVTKQ